MNKTLLTQQDKIIIIDSIIGLFASGSNVKAPTYLYEVINNINKTKNYDELFDEKYTQDILISLNEWLLPKNLWEYSIITGTKIDELKNIIEKLKR